MVSVPSTKTIVVLGSAYAGARAVQILVASCPPGWRVVVIDRNTHFNHLYAFPRVSVLPGHEFKALIPNTNLFHPMLNGQPSNPPGWEAHRFVHARAVHLEPRRVHVEYLSPEHTGPREGTIDFDFIVYALGASLPPPINIWETLDGVEGRVSPDGPHGTKPEGCRWLVAEQERIAAAQSVCIVGGGALGVQYAGDIAEVHPGKKVTLCHSRNLLPLFDGWMHEQASAYLEKAGVDLALGARVNLDGVDHAAVVKGRTITTGAGRTVPAELILICTGQSPNSHLLRRMAPACVNPLSGMVYCRRSMQLADAPATLGDEPSTTRYPHIFVAGDLADAFGALNAGHTAWAQGETAAKNILAIINEGPEAQLERYDPPPYAIKVSLGLRRSITQRGAEHIEGDVADTEEARSLYCHTLWESRGLPIDDMHV